MSFRFDFLPEFALDSPAFLEITLFEQIALLLVEPKSRLAQSFVRLALELLAMQSFALTHLIALLRTHLHPALSIAPECLSIFRRKRKPAVARGFKFRLTVNSAFPVPVMSLRLRLGGTTNQDEDRQCGDYAYKV